jgi:hypothetical protein
VDVIKQSLDATEALLASGTDHEKFANAVGQ